MGECSIAAGPNAALSGAGSVGSPWVISEAAGTWSTTLPNPVFASGLSIGNGSVSGRWRERVSSEGHIAMDYIGTLTVGSSTAITGPPVGLAIPNGRIAAGLQEDAQVMLYDAFTPYLGWWATALGASQITLRAAPAGQLAAGHPFVWATNDTLRWCIRNLLVYA